MGSFLALSRKPTPNSHQLMLPIRASQKAQKVPLKSDSVRLQSVAHLRITLSSDGGVFTFTCGRQSGWSDSGGAEVGQKRTPKC